jgi:hypothetical protein
MNVRKRRIKSFILYSGEPSGELGPAKPPFAVRSLVPVTLRPCLTRFQPNMGGDCLRAEVSNHDQVGVLFVVFSHLYSSR